MLFPKGFWLVVQWKVERSKEYSLNWKGTQVPIYISLELNFIQFL